MLCNKKRQYWPVAMTIDEAIHHDEEYGTMWALTMGGEGCTHADVWRASVRAVAYGRRKRRCDFVATQQLRLQMPLSRLLTSRCTCRRLQLTLWGSLC